MFEGDGTYGPKANFKISLRELPDDGRFRVTVTAAKYNDGLLLDPGATPQASDGSDAVICREPKTPQTVTIKKPGIYQVDVYAAARSETPMPRTRRGSTKGWLDHGRSMATLAARGTPARLEGDAQFVDSPFGKAVSLDGDGDSVVIPRDDAMNVGDGDFTVAAWIHPQATPNERGSSVSERIAGRTAGILDMPDNRGSLRIETAGPDNQSNGTVSSPPGTIRANAWQHVAAVVRRGKNETRLYVNGYPVAKGDIGAGESG